MRKILIIVGTAIVALTLSATSVFAGGPPKAAIYVDDVLYRTVGTPTDFSNTGAPASSFDTIYLLNDGSNADAAGLASVATAAPGDRDFNGGRWMVYGVTWNVMPYQLFNEDEVLQAESDGDISISAEPIKIFECPVIPIGGGH